MQQPQKSSFWVDNIGWFLTSLGLAFLVWVIATSQADPIVTKTFPNIQLQINEPEGVALTALNRRTVTVNVRARQSVMDLLTNEDIIVRASLDNLTPGTHIIPIEASVAPSRQAIADSRPTQVQVTLEQKLSEQKPVVVNITAPPPFGFIPSEAIPSATQMLVTGIASKVQQVARLEAQINLSQQRTSFNQEIDLIPVDANGLRVLDVTVAQPVRVTLEITQDDAVESVIVYPNIDRSSLSDAYVYLGIVDYNPKAVSVTGAEEVLSVLPDTLQTEVIDLSGVTETRTFTVPVLLPDGIFLAEPGKLIEVTVGIEPREDVRQFENVSIEIVGRNNNTEVRVTPTEATVLVRGPLPIIEQLSPANIRVIIDVQGLATGDYELVPSPSINVEQIEEGNISILPSRIGVIIRALDDPDSTRQPEATAQVMP